MAAKTRLTFTVLALLIFTDLIEIFAQFCFKKSVSNAHALVIDNVTDAVLFAKTILPSPFLWLGLLSVLLIFILWVTILSKIDLSVAVPVASFSYIGVPLVSRIFLHEHISVLRWSGMFCILMGVILVSISSRHKTSSE